MKTICIILLGLLLTGCGQDEAPVDASESSARDRPTQQEDAQRTGQQSPASRQEEVAQLRSSELFARLPLPPDFEPGQDVGATDDYPLVIDGATDMSREELLEWATDALPAAGFAITHVDDVRVTGAQTLGMIGHGYQGTAYLADGELGYRFEKTQEPMPPPLEVVIEPQTEGEPAADDQ